MTKLYGMSFAETAKIAKSKAEKEKEDKVHSELLARDAT